MTTELMKTDAKQPIAMGTHGLRLTSLDDATRFATGVIKSRLAPSQFDTVEKVLIAMQYGAEVGFAPMQSLQSIAVINGRPSLYGDALPALVLSSGKCSLLNEWLEGEGDNLTAYCETQRTGMATTKKTSFSVTDAKKAGLWNKKGPWTEYPKRMLAMRARAFNFRDQFADVLRGMGVVEEVQDIPQQPTGGKVLSLESIPENEIQGEVDDQHADELPDFDALEKALAGCNTPSDVTEIANYYAGNDDVQELCGKRMMELCPKGSALFEKG